VQARLGDEGVVVVDLAAQRLVDLDEALKTPSPSVTSVPTVSAIVVIADGMCATTPPPAGSVKYISTISRT
jgi:hypothetical protein